MRFSEINIFGVFVSPVAIMLPAAWLVMVVVRRLAEKTGLWRRFWHPALASLALYVLVLSAIVIGAAAWAGRPLPLVQKVFSFSEKNETTSPVQFAGGVPDAPPPEARAVG